MIHFQHPDLLYLLLLLPLFLVVWIWMQHKGKQRLAQFADKSMFGRLIPDASSWRPTLKFCLLLAALACLILAIANPQMGSKLVKGEHIGGDVAICLDVSNSMMAEDIQPNRLERSKKVVSNLMSQMAGDRISLVVFAGSSYIQMPLTNDYSAVKLFLDQIDCEMIATQGTAIGDAINTSIRGFGSEQSEASRAIILITDGENHEDNAVEAAKMAADNGITINVIGLGKTEGSLIPVEGTNNFWRDKDGEGVITKLNEEMCKNIAAAGKGVYVHADNSNNALRTITKQIESMQKGELEVQSYSQYEDHFFVFLWLALFLLLIDYAVMSRQNHWFNKINLFK